MLKLLSKLQHSIDFYFVLTTSVVLFLLRLPSFFEPYWYGDEGIYEVIGFALRHGRLLYRNIWDNKPPLLYLIYAIFSGDQTGAKVLSFFAGLGALLFFFLLAKKLFQKRIAVYLATLVFLLLIGLPLLEGNIANAENFMLFPIIAAAYFVYTYLQEKKHLFFLILAGILLGFSFLTKVVGVFDFSAFFVFIFFMYFVTNKIHWRNLVSTLFVFTLSFCIPFILTCLFFITTGSFKTFIQSAFLSNVGYVNYGNQIYFPFTHTAIPQGLLLIKLAVLAVVLLITFWKKRNLTTPQLFVYIWLSFSIFNALFSQRPYTHYVLVMVPSFCLLLGETIAEKKLRRLSLAVAILLIIFVGSTFWINDKSISYYQNFVMYLFGKKATLQYQQFFDKSTPRDYAIAQFLQIHTTSGQEIFIWGNSAQIYKLTNTLPPGRYTVEYHITTNAATLEETSRALQKALPRFVVILPNASSFPYHLVHYQPRFTVEGAVIYERTF